MAPDEIEERSVWRGRYEHALTSSYPKQLLSGTAEDSLHFTFRKS